jgi:hypothetical protein
MRRLGAVWAGGGGECAISGRDAGWKRRISGVDATGTWLPEFSEGYYYSMVGRAGRCSLQDTFEAISTAAGGADIVRGGVSPETP